MIACRWQLVLNLAYYAIWGRYAGTATCQSYVFNILMCSILCGIEEFYVHVTVHSNKFLYNKTNQMHQFPKFTPAWNSTCFGQSLCPSSGVYSLVLLDSCLQTCVTYTSAEFTCLVGSVRALFRSLFKIIFKMHTLCCGKWCNEWWNENWKEAVVTSFRKYTISCPE